MNTDKVLPHSDPGLWQSIQNHRLSVRPTPEDSGREPDSFVNALKENLNLTDVSAFRLALEYRRFLYLKASDGGSLTPSGLVDKAWHQHLTSPDYEGDMCLLLGKAPAHQTGLPPSEAGTLYAKTLTLYLQEFGLHPPEDIWPTLERLHRDASDRRRERLGLGLAVAGLGAFAVMKLTGMENLLLGLVALVLFASGTSMGIWYNHRQRRNRLEELPSCG
jgi:hypothetical protein